VIVVTIGLDIAMTGADSWVYLTEQGYQKMVAELHRLKTVDRPRVVGEISRARDMGDISENAEYHAAKERQVLLERKISELEEKLTRVKTIKEDQFDGSRAYLLSIVRLRDIKTGEEIRYQLVSPEEADIDVDRISVRSPIGQGLLGKSLGDRVTIKVPAGELIYDIIGIDRPS
jgi:transcription elongation factor GreA